MTAWLKYVEVTYYYTHTRTRLIVGVCVFVCGKINICYEIVDFWLYNYCICYQKI